MTAISVANKLVVNNDMLKKVDEQCLKNNGNKMYKITNKIDCKAMWIQPISLIAVIDG